MRGQTSWLAMGKQHRKINNRFRVNYVKNEAKKDREKDYKKMLRSWLFPYCRQNREFFGELVKEKNFKAISSRIRDEWLRNDHSVRITNTGFMNNMQYIMALVENIEADMGVDGIEVEKEEDSGDLEGFSDNADDHIDVEGAGTEDAVDSDDECNPPSKRRKINK